MVCSKACSLFLLIAVTISAALCSDSNDILQHLYDLEEGSAQQQLEEKIHPFPEGDTPPVVIGNVGEIFQLEEEELPDIHVGFKVPPAFHFSDVEKDPSKDESEVLDDPIFKEMENIIDEIKEPIIEELEKKTNKVLSASHDDELEILGLAVISRIVLYVAIILLVLGAIVCTKICCPHHHGKRRHGFVRMKDSDKPIKVRSDKLKPVKDIP